MPTLQYTQGSGIIIDSGSAHVVRFPAEQLLSLLDHGDGWNIEDIEIAGKYIRVSVRKDN